MPSEHKRSTSTRITSNIKNFESTLKGFEGLNFNNNDEKFNY